MTGNKRKTVFVDQQVQHGFARRIVMYWCITWLLTFTLPIMVRMFTGQLPFNELASQIIADFWFPIAISVFLIPIVIWDSYRFSHRLAGPVFRISRTIRQLMAGEDVKPIQLRQKDFCKVLADDVNLLIKKQNDNASTQKAETSESLESVA